MHLNHFTLKTNPNKFTFLFEVYYKIVAKQRSHPGAQRKSGVALSYRCGGQLVK